MVFKPFCGLSTAMLGITILLKYNVLMGFVKIFDADL